MPTISKPLGNSGSTESEKMTLPSSAAGKEMQQLSLKSMIWQFNRAAVCQSTELMNCLRCPDEGLSFDFTIYNAGNNTSSPETTNTEKDIENLNRHVLSKYRELNKVIESYVQNQVLLLDAAFQTPQTLSWGVEE